MELSKILEQEAMMADPYYNELRAMELNRKMLIRARNRRLEASLESCSKEARRVVFMASGLRMPAI